ncbi:hypothetical protein [Gallaecimonas pentaromativorans]|uniref:SCP domain-containing protein n=1 Tax=Gallaecimonas pentaromativorans TaxID=584787 RepID=A0A3N1PJ63_9GAMM|nr:hypothetical protein [Gallaecimonas pentaromativorans]ROQ28675.1 hypothetical protein EDC28_103268 [Gallaecimonas pentaromativorans]
MITSLLFLSISLGNCHLTAEELELANALISDKRHIQKPLNCDQDLTWLARARAAMVAQRGKLSPEIVPGMKINNFVALSGYPLLDQDNSTPINSTEVVVGGPEKGTDTWVTITESMVHRSLVLREDTAYQAFDHFGVGHFYKWYSPHVDYWVIVYAAKAPQTAEQNTAP